MENIKAVIAVQGIQEQFIWDAKKHSLLSFLGFVLHKAFLASSKDLAEPLNVNINGSTYQFKNKLVGVKSESLPRIEKIKGINGSLAESLQSNFIGFALLTILKGQKSFENLNFSKDSNINAAAKKATSIVQLAKISLERYKEALSYVRAENEQTKVLCLTYGIGATTKANLLSAKTYKEQYNKLIEAPKISAAAAANEATKVARAEKAAAKKAAAEKAAAKKAAAAAKK
jgi:hypothetical protein